jgi:hypothetical protein
MNKGLSMHKVVFVFILLFQISFFLLAEEVTSFTPLQENETFAFIWHNDEVTFYAIYPMNQTECHQGQKYMLSFYSLKNRF